MNAGENEDCLVSIRHLYRDISIDVLKVRNEVKWCITIDLSRGFGFNFNYCESIAYPGLVCVDFDSISQGHYQLEQVNATQISVNPNRKEQGKPMDRAPDITAEPALTYFNVDPEFSNAFVHKSGEVEQ